MTAPDFAIDVDAAIRGLKDFQRSTVDYVFRRMWLDDDRTHRFLVADEVGLGKTMVAKGVIAKTVEHLRRENVERIDVVYICSNAEIARQNIARLSILGDARFHHSSRITLLPTLIRDIATNPVNFISFTPKTSFEVGRTDGMASERILIYRLLKQAWALGEAAGPKNLLQGGVRDAERFRDWIATSEREQPIDDGLAARFREALVRRDMLAAQKGEDGLQERFEDLLARFPRAGSSIPKDLRIARSRLVGDFRQLLARTCIHALEPDLVILDEFQRFKHLLGADEEDENPAAELAEVLFNYEEREDLGKTRVLLLSATPYRMYTMAGETVDDDHYRDFVDTLRFLQDDPGRTTQVETLLRSYKAALYRMAEDGGEQLRAVKAELESALRRVMVRTERLGASTDRNGMLYEVPTQDLRLEARDAMAFRETQKLARAVGHSDLMEYWKGAPYLMSFARGYALADAVLEQSEEEGDPSELLALVKKQTHLHVPAATRAGDAAVDPPHGRLRWLLDDVTRQGLWDLLWLPPSLPYHSLGGSFAKTNGHITKRLIFSSWRMVPRAIASLLSLEAERRMHGSNRRVPLPEAAGDVRIPLVFGLRGGEASRMSTMALLYPSFSLATLGDPLDIAREMGVGCTPEELLSEIKRRIEDAAAPFLAAAATQGREDDRWYWMLPVLLDYELDATAATRWLERGELSYYWAAEDPEELRADPKAMGSDRGWRTHVAVLRRFRDRGLEQLGKPPADLAEVLALVALAAPGVCALRALARGAGADGLHSVDIRDAAGSVALEFRSLFNVPEVVAMLRGQADDDEAYWRSVLRYCADGGLQSVMDEWAHVLPEAAGVGTLSKDAQAPEVAAIMREALGIRSAQVNAMRLRTTGGNIVAENERYRSRLALRFGDADAVDEGDGPMRASQVRAAFNSPFWPFVLASTTVGQEGLDFHQYCHAVVHWNLPHNPVDLEQREGRVHRYKGHAVRKNVAKAYGSRAIGGGSSDPWSEAFRIAASERATHATDIVPYWVFPVVDGARIERHVPGLPLSRDRERLEQLRRALVLYRMVFGQPRQDELVGYLAAILSAEQVAGAVEELRIDLSPGVASPNASLRTEVTAER